MSPIMTICIESFHQPELLLDCLRACGGRYREEPCPAADGIDCAVAVPSASAVGLETLVVALSSTP